MNSADNITAKKLTDLGVTQPEQVAAAVRPGAFAIRRRFRPVRDETFLETFATPGWAANPAYSPKSPTTG